MYDISLTLSVFVGLIITNCIVLGRIAAFAEANPPVPSFFDGMSNGIGYGLVLMAVGTFREIFGSGTWFGMQVMPKSYVLNGLLVLPSAAFFCIGALVWIQKSISPKLVEKKG
jgi:Na+-transporting NADH:ubiquinone oxidoreductase subunit D